MKTPRIVLIASMAAGLLVGCATVEPPADRPDKQPPAGEPSAADPDRAAYEALARGDFPEAARHFSSLAAATEPPHRQEYQLKAAEALLRGGLLAQSSRLLDTLRPTELTARQEMTVQLLRAENALRQHDPDRALSILTEARAPASESDLHAQYHELRARAFERLGNFVDGAHEYVERERFLRSRVQISVNQTAIWESLSKLSDSELDRLRTLPPPDVFAGWVALVRIAADIRLAAEEIGQRLALWREEYPQHPAAESFAKDLLKRSRELVLRPKRMALLLPTSGRFAAAGAAVRDGFLAAYYRDGREESADIRIYDTGANPKQVVAVYERAVEDGADVVVGPLRKEAVNALAQRESFVVPTVALNFTDIHFAPHDNFFQFALSPEDEARQVAERTWLDGHGRAAAFVPDGEWGERVRRAFDQRWQELGGNVVGVRTYDPKQSDFSRPLQGLLNLDDSHERYRRLARATGRSYEFSPRRRQDIDYIFVAAFPRQSRLIRPQLRFHHAAHVPVYATSHVFAAQANPDQDRDMDGMIFGDMPWTLGTETPYEEVRSEARQHLDQYQGGVQRLVALGVDAYNLIPKLRLLDEYTYERFQGETGSLHVDERNRVRRQLVWARFSRGKPVPLGSQSLGEAPQ